MKERRLVIFLALLSFFYRILIIYNTKVTFFSDDAIYASLARFFYEGNFTHAFHPTWPPLFPFLSAVAFTIFRHWEFSLQLISALSGSLTVIPIYILFRKLFGKYPTTIIAIVITTLTPFLWASIYPLSDMLALFLIESFLAITFVAIQDTKPEYFLISSVFGGLIFLTRSEGSMFFGLTFIFLIAYCIYQVFVAKKFEKRMLFLPLIFAICFFAISFPYILATRLQLEEWTLSQKFSAQIKQSHAFELREGTTWAQEAVSIKSPVYESKYFRGGLKHVLIYNDWFIFWFIEKLGKWNNLVFKPIPSWIWVLFAVGVTRLLTKKYFWSVGFLLFILSATVPMTIFSTPLVELRYLLWIVPIILFLCGIGIQTLLGFLKKKQFSWIFLVLLIMQLPFFSLKLIKHPAEFGQDTTRTMNWEEIKLASSWILANKTKAEPKIMMRHEGIEFYTNGKTIYAPQIQYDQLIDYAKKNNVDYVVAWDKEIAGDPVMSTLLDTTKPHNNLTQVHNIQKNGASVIIYELK